MHRDVKAENILLLSNPAKTNSWHIKLIDFGLAMRVETSPCIFGLCTEKEVPFEALVCGTAYYCAPEVWINDYGPKVDIWAAGVVLYLALLGAFPFYDNDTDVLESMICSSETEPPYKPNCEKECPAYHVSAQARRCVESLLTKDQDVRPTSEEVLKQPWLLHSKPSSASPLHHGSVAAGTAKGLGARAVSAPALREVTQLDEGDQIIPFAVRSRAGRAAARPPVDEAVELSRTSALEALRARVSTRRLNSCSSFASSISWKSPASCQSQEHLFAPDHDDAPATGGLASLRSWTQRDFTGDTTLTDSDVEETTPGCCH